MNRPRTKIAAYLAHPVGTDPDRRRVNLANVLGWMRLLLDKTHWAIAIPWYPYVASLDEATYRERGIADDTEILSRCDIMVACGGCWSRGMIGEEASAYRFGIPVLDLAEGITFEPPIAGTREARIVAERILAFQHKIPRVG